MQTVDQIVEEHLKASEKLRKRLRADPTAGFYTKNHIQLCVRNPDCIKGYFRPLADSVA